MREFIWATPVPADGSRTDILVLEATPFGVPGTGDKKRFLECEVGGAAMSLIERPFNQEFLDAWTAFHAADMPVPTSLWREGNQALLVEDVKANGEEVYGKELYFVLNHEEERFRPRPEIDQLFLHHAHPDRLGAIATKVEEYVDRANNSHLILPVDDPFELLIRPDGTWDLITLDLTRGSSFIPARRRAEKIAEIQRGNHTTGNNFMRGLRLLHGLLDKQTATKS